MACLHPGCLSSLLFRYQVFREWRAAFDVRSRFAPCGCTVRAGIATRLPRGDGSILGFPAVRRFAEDVVQLPVRVLGLRAAGWPG